MSADQFNATVSWDKTAYVTGETITATLTGENVHTADDTVTVETVGPVTVPYVSSSGAKSTFSLAAVDVTHTVTGVVTHEPVFIDTALFNPVQGGRTWTVSADRKSITAVA